MIPTPGIYISSVSLAITLFLGWLTYWNRRGHNRLGSTRLSLDEKLAGNDLMNKLATQQREELIRIYRQLETLETKVANLDRRDLERQKTIGLQHKELMETNNLLGRIRILFLSFVIRVEGAWQNHDVMPKLTTEERKLLEDTTSKGMKS